MGSEEESSVTTSRTSTPRPQRRLAPPPLSMPLEIQAAAAGGTCNVDAESSSASRPPTPSFFTRATQLLTTPNGAGACARPSALSANETDLVQDLLILLQPGQAL